MDPSAAPPTAAANPNGEVAPSQSALNRLRTWNIVAGCAHLLQLGLILVLANDFTLPITAAYLEGPPGTTPADPVVLFNSPIGIGVALFFGLSAAFHFIVASPWGFPRYAAGLGQRHNYFRWVEYSLSSSVMMVLIAQIVGVTDIGAIVAIFGVNASMIFFGWLQEKYETPGSGGMLPFIFGCMAGIVPWIVVVIFLIAPGATSPAEPPAFVYGIVASLFVFFNCFAVVQLLQYRARGKWANYLYGEKVYIILSLVAKSLLAWQVFAGTLAG
jgi:hypothetical protein